MSRLLAPAQGHHSAAQQAYLLWATQPPSRASILLEAAFEGHRVCRGCWQQTKGFRLAPSPCSWGAAAAHTAPAQASAVAAHATFTLPRVQRCVSQLLSAAACAGVAGSRPGAAGQPQPAAARGAAAEHAAGKPVLGRQPAADAPLLAAPAQHPAHAPRLRALRRGGPALLHRCQPQPVCTACPCASRAPCAAAELHKRLLQTPLSLPYLRTPCICALRRGGPALLHRRQPQPKCTADLLSPDSCCF